jgi:PAS domain S-box-containing protein
MRNYKLFTEPVHQGIINRHDPLFSAVFDESPDAIFLLDTDSFEIIDCNAKALQLFQALDKTELKGRESFSLYDSEPVEFSKNSLIETINRGQEHSQELAFKSLKGNIFWGRASLRKVDIKVGSLIIFRVRRVIDYMKTTEMLSSMVKHTAKATGVEFFCVLTELLSKNFGISTALVAKIDPEHKKAFGLCCWHKTGRLDKVSFDLAASPSQNVLKGYTTFYPSNLREMFPEDLLIKKLDAESFMGTPVFNASGEVCGLLILMDGRIMEEIPNSRHILTLFASRCGAEFERLETEENYRNRIRELEGKIGKRQEVSS